jgi:Protein of unknown function (DUF1194)
MAYRPDGRLPTRVSTKFQNFFRTSARDQRSLGGLSTVTFQGPFKAVFAMMTRFSSCVLALLFGSGAFPFSGAAFSCPDLALVLAIDGSGSIDDRDFDLQQTGYAAAFADPKVQGALASAGVVDVAVVLWGDEEIAPQVLPWRRVAGPGDALALAADIDGMPRRVTGDTGIGAGLWAALDLLEDGEGCAARRIINVSGDGRESFSPRPRQHVPLALARERAGAMDVTINGLAITVDDPGLEGWFRSQVITGPDAFVMSATSFETFGAAIIRKLSHEIALPVMAAADISQEITR